MTTNPFELLDQRLDRIEVALTSHLNERAQEDPYPPVLSLVQASELLGYSTEYLYQLRSRNQIPCLSAHKGQRLRFSRDILRKWLAMGAPKDALAIGQLMRDQQR